MARPARPWFRFYVEACHDRKLRRLKPEHRWLFVVCLSVARQSPTPGTLLIGEDDPMDWDDIVDWAAMPLRQVEKGMDELQARGLVVWLEDRWVVPKWEERQYESDTSAKRTRDYRERHSDGGCDVTTTPVVTSPDTETDTEAEEPLAPAGRALTVARPRDPIWDALIAAWGLDGRELTRIERDRINAAAKQLRDIGADPDEIPARKQMFQIQWPTITATMHAVVGRWAECRPDLSRLPGKVPRATSSIARAVAKGSP